MFATTYACDELALPDGVSLGATDAVAAAASRRAGRLHSRGGTGGAIPGR